MRLFLLASLGFLFLVLGAAYCWAWHADLEKNDL